MNIINSMLKFRKEILFLSYQKVKIQYLQTAFGIVWALIQPLTFVFTLWFFFAFGLRASVPVEGVPFVVFLFSGYMVWNLISSCIIGGSRVFTSNAVLVKTIKFPIMTLPLIDVLSKMYVHIAVMGFIIIVFMFNGVFPSLYYINLIYYWIMLVLFLTAFSFVLSTISIMIKDIPLLISSIMMPLFWITPILWEATGVIKYLMMIFNPFYYFVLGFQETFIYKKFFWESPLYMIYMWLIIEVLFLIGLRMYEKIRPIMADII